MPAAVQGARPSAGALGCRGGCRAHHEGAPCATGLLVEEVRSAGCSRWLADVEQAASTCCLGHRNRARATKHSGHNELEFERASPPHDEAECPPQKILPKRAALSAHRSRNECSAVSLLFKKHNFRETAPRYSRPTCRPKPGWRPSRPDRLQRLRQLQQPERLRRLRRLQRLRQPGQPPLRSRLR